MGEPAMGGAIHRGAAGAAREVELLARVAEGDRRALEELYNLYHRRMMRFLMRVTRHYEIAEEVINDTFWVVWRNARSFRGASQPSTWIFGIAYRKARNAVRSCARLTQKTLQLESLLPASEEPGSSEELRDWLARALAQLPLHQRLAVELCYELGCSCEEIATITGCPVNTVKTRLFHARAKLQKLLPLLASPAAAPGRPPEEPHTDSTAKESEAS